MSVEVSTEGCVGCGEGKIIFSPYCEDGRRSAFLINRVWSFKVCSLSPSLVMNQLTVRHERKGGAQTVNEVEVENSLKRMAAVR